MSSKRWDTETLRHYHIRVQDINIYGTLIIHQFKINYSKKCIKTKLSLNLRRGLLRHNDNIIEYSARPSWPQELGCYSVSVYFRVVTVLLCICYYKTKKCHSSYKSIFISYIRVFLSQILYIRLGVLLWWTERKSQEKKVTEIKSQLYLGNKVTGKKSQVWYYILQAPTLPKEEVCQYWRHSI